MRLLISLILLSLAGCANQAEELLPIPAAIRNASVVRTVKVEIARTAAADVTRLDAGAALPFERTLAGAIESTARSWGLTEGRALKLIVEIDDIEFANVGAALIVGDRDRLAGSVFVRDAATDEALGQLYIDVRNTHSGPIGLLLRGGGIRDALAQEFAAHIARALTGRSAPPR